MTNQNPLAAETLTASSEIKFGFYNNNNKKPEQHEAWHQSWSDFSAGEIWSAIEKICFYIKDDKEQNLVYERNETGIYFRLFQGSAQLAGSFDGEQFYAKSIITKLEKTSPVIMRRLLDRNQRLLFSRIALDGDYIVAMMNFPLNMLNPSIIYSGMQELLLLADELDDSLAQLFGQAVAYTGNDLKQAVPEQEAATKYQFFKKWIAEAQEHIKAANRSDLQTVGVYIPLTLVHRIQYLCSPKGMLEEKLRNINKAYWENVQTNKLNVAGIYQKLAQLVQELDQIPETEFKECLYRTRDSYSSRGTMGQKETGDIINHSVAETRDIFTRSFAGHAFYSLEFALGNLIYDFNLPYILVELYHLQMQALHPEFFAALGLPTNIFKEDGNTLNVEWIKESLQSLIDKNKALFSEIVFDESLIDYKDAYSFCLSLAIASEKLIHTLN